MGFSSLDENSETTNRFSSFFTSGKNFPLWVEAEIVPE